MHTINSIVMLYIRWSCRKKSLGSNDITLSANVAYGGVNLEPGGRRAVYDDESTDNYDMQ